jgi:DNA-directed RNA polymerase specialized sigma24 family protein
MRRYSKQLHLIRGTERLLAISAAPYDPRRSHPRRVSHRLTDRLPAETLAAIALAYQQGTHTTQLCRNYQLSKSAVLKVLADAGVQMRRQAMASDQIAVSVELYVSGLSLSKVAAEVGVPKGSVRRALLRVGVQLRPPTGDTRVRGTCSS